MLFQFQIVTGEMPLLAGCPPRSHGFQVSLSTSHILMLNLTLSGSRNFGTPKRVTPFENWYLIRLELYLLSALMWIELMKSVPPAERVWHEKIVHDESKIRRIHLRMIIRSSDKAAAAAAKSGNYVV